MDNLDPIAEAIRADLETLDSARETALKKSRELIRHCANTIRAVHRHHWDDVDAGLAAVRTAADELLAAASEFPELLYAGYTQDALKEYVEAYATKALVRGDALPTPQDLNVPSNTYLNGLAEAASELRRHILDILRQDFDSEAERLLDAMDTIYGTLVTFDFPDAVTGGLRRRVDQLRGVLERTRGDLTSSIRQEKLQKALKQFEERVGGE